MATRRWLDVDGNWANTANWSGAAVPVDGDTIVIESGSKDIVTNIAQTALDPALFSIGGQFAGTLGTPATPMTIGNITTFRYSAPYCRSFNLTPLVVTYGVVQNAMKSPNALYLVGGGWTALDIARAGYARIGASLTATTLTIAYLTQPLADALVAIDSGASLTTLRLLGGRVENQAALTTVEVSGGLLNHKGDTTGNITTLNQWGGAVKYNANGMTLATGNIYGGLLDCSEFAYPRTITNLTVFPGGVANLDNEAATITVTNTPTNRGGIIRYNGTVDTRFSGGWGAGYGGGPPA